MKNKVYIYFILSVLIGSVYSQNITVYGNAGTLIGPEYAHLNTYGVYTFQPYTKSGPITNVWYLSSGSFTDYTLAGTTFTGKYKTTGRVWVAKESNFPLYTKVNNTANHTASARFSVNNQGFSTALESDFNPASSPNYIPVACTVDLRITPNSDIVSFSCSFVMGNANVTSNDGNGNIRFSVNGSADHLLKCDFNWGCCTTTKYYLFRNILQSGYSVNYQPDSDVVSLSKDPDKENYVQSNDRYDIIDAATGSIKKNGIIVSEETQIDVSGLSNGIYVIRILSGGQSQSLKIMINK